MAAPVKVVTTNRQTRHDQDVDHYSPPNYTTYIPKNRDHRSKLPPIKAYSFVDILQSAEGSHLTEFNAAIDGIAELCAKSNMALADEYGAHLPPLGEITEADARAHADSLVTASRAGPSKGLERRMRTGMKRRLTTVAEGGSSGSSSGGSVGDGRRRLWRLRWRSGEKKADNSEENTKQRGARNGKGIMRTMEIGKSSAVLSEENAVGIGNVQSRLDVESVNTEGEAVVSLKRLLERRRLEHG